MPFPDVACLVTVAMQNVSETVMIRVHTQFINRHAGATGVFSGEERSAIGRAHRTARDSVA